jgi:dienelactone hydrolase
MGAAQLMEVPMSLRSFWMAGLVAMLSLASCARAEAWRSEVVGQELNVTAQRPDAPAQKAGYTTVVVLRQLPGRAVDAGAQTALEAAWAKEGIAVVAVDYANTAQATPTTLSPDVLKLRRDLTAKDRTLLKDLPVNAARLFVVPEGVAIRQDVEFARDGDRVLAADVLYPVTADKAARPASLLVEVTCDNANRMGTASLLFCRDTLLETGLLHGFAVAMIDHPVKPPYKGIDDLPANRETMRAALSKMRDVSKELGLSGRIGVMGFSRGATMSAVSAADKSLVQAALVHGNRFDYTQLGEKDPMLARFAKAWGPIEQAREKWVAQSAATYLTKDAAPMFLNTSDAESAEYRLGLEQLAKKLDELGVEHVYQVDADGRGHRVSTDPKTLAAIMAFFAQHLDGATTAPMK